jgi:arsenite oxidase small subunit
MSEAPEVPAAGAGDDLAQRSRRTVSRRRFLKFAGIGGVAVGASGLAACEFPGTSQQAPTSFGESSIAKIKDLKVGQVANANYPDDKSPILIFKLGQRVPDGVGADGDIVAYSSICTHLGCAVAWKPETKVLSCPCHFSSFDPARGGLLIMGQATTNLPQVILKVSGQDLVATGIRGLIWGRQTNLQQLG